MYICIWQCPMNLVFIFIHEPQHSTRWLTKFGLFKGVGFWGTCPARFVQVLGGFGVGWFCSGSHRMQHWDSVSCDTGPPNTQI